MQTFLESAQRSGFGTWIEVRVDRLISNIRALKHLSGPGYEVMAVVKANAYGHGLLETARALEPETNFLGVSSLQEALELREHGITSPVFLFGRLFGPEIATAVKHGITLSISSLDE